MLVVISQSPRWCLQIPRFIRQSVQDKNSRLTIVRYTESSKSSLIRAENQAF